MNTCLAGGIVAMGILLSFPHAPVAQWVQTGGPEGRSIDGLAACGSAIVARIWSSSDTAYNIYLSTNNGTTWTSANTGLADRKTISFAVADSTFLAATTTGIFRLMDNSHAWIAVNSGFVDSNAITALAASGSAIFAVTAGGVFRSTDNGARWVALDFGVGDSVHVTSIAANDSTVIASTWKGVFRSTNNGDSWTPANAGLADSSSVSKLVMKNGIVVANSSQGIVRSSNNGQSWATVNSGLADSLHIQQLVMTDSCIFAGGTWRNGIFRLPINGTQWMAVDSGLTNRYVLALAASGNDIFIGTSGGVYLSTDNGNYWKSVNSGLGCITITSFITNGNTIFAGTAGCGVCRSINNGASWDMVNSGIMDGDICLFAASGNTIYTGTRNGSIFHSINNGESWNGQRFFWPMPVSIAVSGTNLIAGTIGIFGTAHGGTPQGCFFLSKDNGLNWTMVLTASYCMLARVYLSLASYGNKVLAVSTTVCFGGDIVDAYLSSDNGMNWTKLNSPGFSIISLATVDSDFIAGAATSGYFNSEDSGAVLISSDNGATWKPADSGLPDSINVNTFAVSNGNIFAGTSKGVCFSSNKGTNWISVDSGFPVGDYAVSLAVCGSDLFAGTDHSGIWRRPISEMTGTVYRNKAGEQQKSFDLKLKVPNRSNPMVNISFNLSASEHVAVKIYNTRGREVATLFNDNLGPGSHVLSWNTSRIASGCYMMKVLTGNKTYMKNITVLR